MKFLFLFIFFFFIQAPIYSQLYKPVDTLDIQKVKLLLDLNTKTKLLEEEFKSYEVRDKKIIKRFVNDRMEMVKELTKDNYLFFDDELDEYINGFLKTIAQSNGINPAGLKVLLSRDTSPNAYSLGDGNFVFSLSLLNRLENEEELGFILSHELAHYLLDHLKEQISKSMSMAKSTDYIKKRKELKKSRYSNFSKSLEQYKEMHYVDSKTRRIKEQQADSLGFHLFSKIARTPQNALFALQKMDTLSPAEMLKVDMEMLKNHFSTPTMPFKDEWTKGYDFSKYNYQVGKMDIFGIHKDSLRTHPEKAERILNLENLVQEVSFDIKDNNYKVDGFKQLKEKIRFEDVYAHYCLEEYGRGIYLIIQLQNIGNPTENAKLFYSHMLSLFYQKLVDARTSFKFKKYVDDIHYLEFSKEYTLFLTILDNLRSSELQEISNNYKVN